ncbi:MAG TPA: SAM-dependent methyltransferase, partial [Planctomycetaceae bacterium]|nr:SAM-dependent methyltransferase [Planctomycetaceae bacterium]
MPPAVVSAAEVERLLAEALVSGDCLSLVLSKPRRGAVVPFTKVSVRPVIVQKRPAYQFAYQSLRKETHENHGAAAAGMKVMELLLHAFENVHLFTPKADYEIRASGKESFRIRETPPSRTSADLNHNRPKEHLIPEGVPCEFLTEIGVMNREGRVLAAKYNKFRQINRFLELVEDVIDRLPRDRTLQIYDFGSGKSYLTFALHHLLTQLRDFDAEIIGIDRNPEIVADCARIATHLRCRGLEFRTGDIGSIEATGDVHMVVSLHACDTATDDALAQAIRWETPVIFSVPCCQHELSLSIQNEQLHPITQHGILHDRFAALATDALRAAALRICGWQTRIVEFIDLEHTPKNLLIRAVRQSATASQQEAAVAEYQRFK